VQTATIGSALRNRRRELGIDQKDAAAQIGMSRTTFSSYERDLQRPSAEVLPPLAGFLDITIEDMLTLYGATCIEALRPQLERLTPSALVARAAPAVMDEPDAIDDSPPEVTSVSIFANELSDGAAPSPVGQESSGTTAPATRVVDVELRDEVTVPTENGTKKKKKKKKKKH
jgi:transcriptional regulator with XRE-family HTH domain